MLSVLFAGGSAGFFAGTIEERAVAWDVATSTPMSGQSADISAAFAGSDTNGSDTTDSSPQPLSVAMMDGTAVFGATPPDNNYLDSITGHRSSVVEYTVADGDLLSFIASDFGVSTDSIIWANNLRNADSIAPGQVLRIPPVTGIMYTIKAGDSAASLAKKYGSTEDQIVAFNHLPQDGVLSRGTQIVIPGGHPLTASHVPVDLTTASFDAKIRRVGMYTEAGSILTAMKFAYLPDLGDYFMNPTTGRDEGILHDRNGVDEANAIGTPIVAAAAGIVTVADDVCETRGTNCNGGFGYYIKISHPNGTETLYAHTSKILVKVGQVVAKGEKIALMGSTGRSTGPHLHFEVHGARNPLANYAASI